MVMSGLGKGQTLRVSPRILLLYGLFLLVSSAILPLLLLHYQAPQQHVGEETKGPVDANNYLDTGDKKILVLSKDELHDNHLALEGPHKEHIHIAVNELEVNLPDGNVRGIHKDEDEHEDDNDGDEQEDDIEDEEYKDGHKDKEKNKYTLGRIENKKYKNYRVGYKRIVDEDDQEETSADEEDLQVIKVEPEEVTRIHQGRQEIRRYRKRQVPFHARRLPRRSFRKRKGAQLHRHSIQKLKGAQLRRRSIQKRKGAQLHRPSIRKRKGAQLRRRSIRKRKGA